MGRRKDLSAGDLCVYVVKQQSWFGLALLPFRVILGLSRPEHDVELFKVRHLSIRSSHRRLRLARDGETAKEATPLVFRIRPQALRVLAPPVAVPVRDFDDSAAIPLATG